MNAVILVDVDFESGLSTRRRLYKTIKNVLNQHSKKFITQTISFDQLDFGQRDVLDKFYNYEYVFVDLSIPPQRHSILYHLGIRNWSLRGNPLSKMTVVFVDERTLTNTTDLKNICANYCYMPFIQLSEKLYLTQNRIGHRVPIDALNFAPAPCQRDEVKEKSNNRTLRRRSSLPHNLQAPTKHSNLVNLERNFGRNELKKKKKTAQSQDLEARLHELLQQRSVMTTTPNKASFLESLRIVTQIDDMSERRKELMKLRKRLDNTQVFSADLVLNLLLAQRDAQDYDAMVTLIEQISSLPGEHAAFAREPPIQYHYAFALNRRNKKDDRVRAEKVITKLLDDAQLVVDNSLIDAVKRRGSASAASTPNRLVTGPSPPLAAPLTPQVPNSQTPKFSMTSSSSQGGCQQLSQDVLCLAGRIEKDKFIESRFTDCSARDKAIDYYERGFQVQQNEYAAINLATLLATRGDDPTKHRCWLLLSTLLGGKGTLDQQDNYWDVACYYELSLIANRYERAVQAAERMYHLRPPEWYLSSTIRNARMILAFQRPPSSRGSFSDGGGDVPNKAPAQSPIQPNPALSFSLGKPSSKGEDFDNFNFWLELLALAAGHDPILDVDDGRAACCASFFEDSAGIMPILLKESRGSEFVGRVRKRKGQQASSTDVYVPARLAWRRYANEEEGEDALSLLGGEGSRLSQSRIGSSDVGSTNNALPLTRIDIYYHTKKEHGWSFNVTAMTLSISLCRQDDRSLFMFVADHGVNLHVFLPNAPLVDAFLAFVQSAADEEVRYNRQRSDLSSSIVSGNFNDRPVGPPLAIRQTTARFDALKFEFDEDEDGYRVVLGRGHEGCVYSARDSVTQVSLAVKETRVRNQDQVDAIKSEVALLTRFQHKNIVRYHGCMEAVNDDGYNVVQIIMEQIPGGSLRRLVRDKWGPLGDREESLSYYTKQILEGVRYLHKNLVVHRDIKTDNILINTHTGVLKISDFGLSKQLSLFDKAHTFLGTAYFMAPEVVSATLQQHLGKAANDSDDKGTNVRAPIKGYGSKVDIWAIGCTILEMATAQLPFPGTEGYVLNQLTIGNAPAIPDNLSEATRDFLSKCFIIDPSSRPNAVELLQHRFITTYDPALTPPSQGRNRSGTFSGAQSSTGLVRPSDMGRQQSSMAVCDHAPAQLKKMSIPTSESFHTQSKSTGERSRPIPIQLNGRSPPSTSVGSAISGAGHSGGIAIPRAASSFAATTTLSPTRGFSRPPFAKQFSSSPNTNSTSVSGRQHRSGSQQFSNGLLNSNALVSGSSSHISSFEQVRRDTEIRTQLAQILQRNEDRLVRQWYDLFRRDRHDGNNDDVGEDLGDGDDDDDEDEAEETMELIRPVAQALTCVIASLPGRTTTLMLQTALRAFLETIDDDIATTFLKIFQSAVNDVVKKEPNFKPHWIFSMDQLVMQAIQLGLNFILPGVSNNNNEDILDDFDEGAETNDVDFDIQQPTEGGNEVFTSTDSIAILPSSRRDGKRVNFSTAGVISEEETDNLSPSSGGTLPIDDFETPGAVQSYSKGIKRGGGSKTGESKPANIRPRSLLGSNEERASFEIKNELPSSTPIVASSNNTAAVTTSQNLHLNKDKELRSILAECQAKNRLLTEQLVNAEKRYASLALIVLRNHKFHEALLLAMSGCDNNHNFTRNDSSSSSVGEIVAELFGVDDGDGSNVRRLEDTLQQLRDFSLQ